MGIPNAQLETWSHQGSIQQSAATYGTIKRALESSTVPFADRRFDIFLQGSYGNNTNISVESDVDVVILYNGAFYNDLSALGPEQKASFEKHFNNCTYQYDQFKSHVQTALRNAFGNAANFGGKAFKISATSGRRSADVIVAFEYRRYHHFVSNLDQSFASGMTFWTGNNLQIVNYPKLHSESLTAKHQATQNKFKPVIRIFKNLRGKLVDAGLIQRDIAPSYFIEGLLYNVPNDKFSGDLANTVRNVLNWLFSNPNRSNFVCANEQYYLLRDDNSVCWPSANCTSFINAAIDAWNRW